MARVRVERDVGHDAEVGEALLQLADDARHEPLLVQRLASVGALQRLLEDGEERHHGDAQAHALLGDRIEAIERHALHPRHRRHVLDDVLASEDEHRQDQVARVDARLAHEVAAPAVAAQAPRAARRIGWRRQHGAILGGCFRAASFERER
jgi:hypothetical protein